MVSLSYEHYEEPVCGSLILNSWCDCFIAMCYAQAFLEPFSMFGEALVFRISTTNPDALKMHL